MTHRKLLGGLLNGFLTMPVKDKLALALAWPLMLVAAAVLRLFHFRHLAGLLGTSIGATAVIPLLNDKQAERAKRVKRAVRRAARVSPARSDCLPQLFAGTILCRMLGVPSAGYLGVCLDGDAPMEAHAWLCAGPIPVTGGRCFTRYTVAACFVRPALPPTQSTFAPL